MIYGIGLLITLQTCLSVPDKREAGKSASGAGRGQVEVKHKHGDWCSHLVLRGLPDSLHQRGCTKLGAQFSDCYE